jgi:hypothetical protein
MYRQPYTTSPDRSRDLRSQRTAHRERTMGPRSTGTKKSYGGGRSGGGGRRGGGRFGVRRAPGAPAPVRLG